VSLAPLLASVRMNWETPEEVLRRVRDVSPIALDPCTTVDNPCGATWFYTVKEDGLYRSWRRRRQAAAQWSGTDHPAEHEWLVYMNPPYGRELPRWIAKAIAEAAQGAEIIALVPSRTDTRWWKLCVESAAAIRHWHGRITFRGAAHPAPFPSALIYWGHRPSGFHAAFAARTVIGGVGGVPAEGA